MNENECKVFFARNINELLYQFKTIQGLKIIGSSTALEHLPEKSISTTLIPELCQIVKHERFLEIGPGVTINELLNIGSRNVPSILYEAAKDIGNPFLRNLSTIGGNICTFPHRLSLFASLLALDANFEIKNQTETKYVNAVNFTQLENKDILTKIRIPLNDWDVSIFRRLGPDHKISNLSAGFAFLADSEKRVISSIRIAFSGPFSFRASSLENRLLGLRLPLNSSEIANYMTEAQNAFDSAAREADYAPILRQQFSNLVEYSLEQLT